MQPLKQLRDDSLFALRVMRKAPLVTATIVLCLGFSIGAVKGICSVEEFVARLRKEYAEASDPAFDGWTVNARALMNFISLRAAEAAQREIRSYADAVEHFFEAKMPVTHAAFVAAGRVAP